MKAQTTLLQTVKIIAESIFPRRKHSSAIEQTQEKEIHDRVTILKNKDHTALLPYSNKTVKNLLYAIKYENHKKSVDIASDILSEHLFDEIQEEEVIRSMHYITCTIPITKERRNKNGHDHMHTLLRKIHRKLPDNRAVYKKDLLRWARETKRQSRIKERVKRIHNMCHAMQATKPLSRNTVCFIIDDITTTGATLSEAKRALTEAGAETVITIALAH